MERIKVLAMDAGVGFAKTAAGRGIRRELGIQALLGGIRSLEFVTNQVPDIILMDIDVPEFKGLETLRHVKQTNPEIQVIILAEEISGVDKMAAYFYGAWAILEKPVAVDSLYKTILSAYRSGPGESGAGAGCFSPKPGQTASPNPTVLPSTFSESPGPS